MRVVEERKAQHIAQVHEQHHAAAVIQRHRRQIQSRRELRAVGRFQRTASQSQVTRQLAEAAARTRAVLVIQFHVRHCRQRRETAALREAYRAQVEKAVEELSAVHRQRLGDQRLELADKAAERIAFARSASVLASDVVDSLMKELFSEITVTQLRAQKADILVHKKHRDDEIDTLESQRRDDVALDAAARQDDLVSDVFESLMQDLDAEMEAGRIAQALQKQAELPEVQTHRRQNAALQLSGRAPPPVLQAEQHGLECWTCDADAAMGLDTQGLTVVAAAAGTAHRRSTSMWVEKNTREKDLVEQVQALEAEVSQMRARVSAYDAVLDAQHQHELVSGVVDSLMSELDGEVNTMAANCFHNQDLAVLVPVAAAEGHSVARGRDEEDTRLEAHLLRKEVELEENRAQLLQTEEMHQADMEAVVKVSHCSSLMIGVPEVESLSCISAG